MKNNSTQLLGCAVIGSIGSASAATVLAFDNQGANGTGIPDTYGDNVTTSDATNGITATLGIAGFTGTPNIGVEYTGTLTAFDSYPSWNGRGAVAQTDYGQGPVLTLELIPEAGFGALLSSFDLDEFAGGGDTVVSWSVNNGATVIVSGIWNDFSDAVGGNGGRTTINTGMTVAQAEANANSTISLNLVLDSGTNSYQALDNLSFDQVSAVPEAGTAALCLAGLGVGAMRRRRK